jgi:geranylgeranyl diphosphate synthase type II
MVAGQYLDMQAEGRARRPGERAVRTIHARKTGALFAAALEAGGAIGGAPAGACRKLRRIGLELGLAFQIVDDLLDERSSERVLGKPVRSDRARGKATYPAAVGFAGAERAVARHVRAAIAGASVFPAHRAHFAHLAACIAERDA